MSRNLLIMSAGEHGQVVAETAMAAGTYDKVLFLDDYKMTSEVVGKMEDYAKQAANYDAVFLAVGNCKRRREWAKRMNEEGIFPYEKMSALIHPAAWVSPSAVLGPGVLVEAMAVINANAVIGQGTIVGIGVKVDHNAEVGEFCHLDTGCILGARAYVEDLTKVSAGCIILENE